MDRREFLKAISSAVLSTSPFAGISMVAGAEDRKSVQTVYVFAKCHLNIGLTDTERNVVSTYFSEYLPHAMKVAETFRGAGGEERYVWTIASWMLYEYLERASPKERKQMEDAIAFGDIAWDRLWLT